MTEPKFCAECVWATPEEKSEWNLKCTNPRVNAKDPWALASARMNGTSCRDERQGNWFSACGKRGAQWEDKI